MPARKKFGFYLLQWIIFFMWSTQSTYGGTAPSFSNLPANMHVEDEVLIDVFFTGNPSYYKDKTYYLRAVFYQEEKKYCGLTQNNAGSWIGSGTTPIDLFSFTTNQEGSWSGKLKTKIDKDSSNCAGSGEYYFMIGRYTSSSVSWSQHTLVQIINPTPTPTSIPTPSSTPIIESEQASINQTESPFEESILKMEKILPTPKGLVAGYSIDETQATATFSDHLEIDEKIIATTSAIPIFQTASISAESEAVREGVGNKLLYIGMSILGASIVSFVHKKYNILLIWQKIFHQLSNL